MGTRRIGYYPTTPAGASADDAQGSSPFPLVTEAMLLACRREGGSYSFASYTHLRSQTVQGMSGLELSRSGEVSSLVKLGPRALERSVTRGIVSVLLATRCCRCWRTWRLDTGRCRVGLSLLVASRGG